MYQFKSLSIEILKKIIDICHKYDVYVSTGGFIERVIVQGSDRYLEESKSLGFDEVSSGLAPISLRDKVDCKAGKENGYEAQTRGIDDVWCWSWDTYFWI